MIETILLGCMCVLSAYFAKYKFWKYGLNISFAMVFIFLALRYNYGNDYHAYLDKFTEISKYNEFNLHDVLKNNDMEIGWVYLNWLFRYSGFFVMTAVLALVNSCIYYGFIKSYVPIKYYWLAVFIYIFYPEFMLVHSSAMRQSVAIMLFVFSIKYIYRKDAVRYFLLISLACLFHISAIILFPAFLLGVFNFRLGIFAKIFLFLAYIFLFLFAKELSPHLLSTVASYFEKYAGYQDEGIFNSGLGVVYFSMLFILTLIFINKQNKKISLISKMAIISFILLPLNLMVFLASRLAMYFATATIILYPTIYMSLKNNLLKIFFLWLVIIATIYRFLQFFYSDTYNEFFSEYQTIFSALEWH
jgi:hypothetical protein